MARGENAPIQILVICSANVYRLWRTDVPESSKPPRGHSCASTYSHHTSAHAEFGTHSDGRATTPRTDSPGSQRRTFTQLKNAPSVVPRQLPR